MHDSERSLRLETAVATSLRVPEEGLLLVQSVVFGVEESERRLRFEASLRISVVCR